MRTQRGAGLAHLTLPAVISVTGGFLPAAPLPRRALLLLSLVFLIVSRSVHSLTRLFSDISHSLDTLPSLS